MGKRYYNLSCISFNSAGFKGDDVRDFFNGVIETNGKDYAIMEEGGESFVSFFQGFSNKGEWILGEIKKMNSDLTTFDFSKISSSPNIAPKHYSLTSNLSGNFTGKTTPTKSGDKLTQFINERSHKLILSELCSEKEIEVAKAKIQQEKDNFDSDHLSDRSKTVLASYKQRQYKTMRESLTASLEPNTTPLNTTEPTGISPK